MNVDPWSSSVFTDDGLKPALVLARVGLDSFEGILAPITRIASNPCKQEPLHEIPLVISLLWDAWPYLYAR